MSFVTNAGLKTTLTKIKTIMDTQNAKVAGDLESAKTELNGAISTAQTTLQGNIDAANTAIGAAKTELTGAIGTAKTELEGKITEAAGEASTAVSELESAVDGKLDTKVDVVAGSSLVSDTEIAKLASIVVADGIISADNLPATAFERCKVVASMEAMYALTKADVQNGDTVKVAPADGEPKMYMVIDDTKLAEAAGYTVYTANTDWASVSNIPAKVTAPQTLNIKVNGKSIATYTGFEEAAVEANIVPDDIGLEVITTEEINNIFDEVFVPANPAE